MTDAELIRNFENGLKQLPIEEVRRFLKFQHFGVCADCGKPIWANGGRHKRCEDCQKKRNQAKQKASKIEYNKRWYTPTHYQKIVGKSVGR